jgi:hypothetical protein
MCPACIATTLTLAVGSVTATGGLIALVLKGLHKTCITKRKQTTERKGGSNESSAIQTGNA